MNEEAGTPLDLRFKGERTYLHGTDLFDAMVELARRATGAGVSDIRMSFYRPIRRSVAARRVTSGAAVPRPCALFELKSAGQPVAWELIEGSEPVAGRRPYDETDVTAGAVVRDRLITQPAPTAYSFIERVVALNKRLLDQLRGDPSVSWWFGRLELSRLPAPAPALDLRVETDLGARLVRSSIEIDGRREGSIYFSEKKSA